MERRRAVRAVGDLPLRFLACVRRGGLVSACVLEQLSGNRRGDELEQLDDVGRVELEQLDDVGGLLLRRRRLSAARRGSLSFPIRRRDGGADRTDMQWGRMLGRVRFGPVHPVELMPRGACLPDRCRRDARPLRATMNLRHDTKTRRTCACGVHYSGADWNALALIGAMDDGAGELLELRNCTHCGSSMCLPSSEPHLLREVIASRRAIAAMLDRLAELGLKDRERPNTFDGLWLILSAFQQGYRGADRSVPAPVAGV